MEKAENLFIEFIKSEINPSAEGRDIQPIDVSTQRKLYVLTKRHDLAHFISRVISKNELSFDGQVLEKFEEEERMAVYRYENIRFELAEISEAFEKAKIPFVPLKGARLRALYPQPWLRTSCDIDVLVREEDLPRAIQALTEEKGYVQKGKKQYHDVSLFAPSGVHLELHFNILENRENIDKLLRRVWEYCSPVNDGAEYAQSNEFFLFHFLAHAYYHFISGGCGVRPLLDIWLIEQHLPYHQEKLFEMLDFCGIKTFYEQIRYLSEVWFSGKAHTDISLKLQEYIFQGGVYGTTENKIAVKKASGQRKFSYIRKRIFLPYSALVNVYPTLKKHKWLTPFYEVRRWFTIVFDKRAHKLRKEMRAYDGVTEERKAATAQLWRELDIQDGV